MCATRRGPCSSPIPTASGSRLSARVRITAGSSCSSTTTKTADQADAEAAAEGNTLTEAREEGSPAAEGLETPTAEAADATEAAEAGEEAGE